MSEVQALPVAEVDYKWPDDELVVRLSDYDALAAECERLHGEVSDLHTTMMAAAVEIQGHWAAHCDEEGYGPANLMHRLEHGIASQYGYNAETVVRMEAQKDAALADLAALKGGQEAATNRKTWSPAATGFSCLHCGTARAYHDMQTFCPTGPAFASGSSSAKPVAPPAQASAWPEGGGITIERDLMGAMHIKLGDFDFIQIQYQYPYTDNAGTRKLAERIAELIAAAPTPSASASDGKGGDV